MKAVILAAGMGTRLGTLIPKPLTSIVDEKTIMDFQVEKLAKKVGIDNIIVVVGYKKELIMEKFPQLTYVYNSAYAHTNTSKSLLCALNKVEEDAVWMNGDVFFQEEVLDILLESKSSALLVDTKKCGEEEMKYTLDSDGNVASLSKHVTNGSGEAVGVNFVKQGDVATLVSGLASVKNHDYFEKAIEELITSRSLTVKPILLNEYLCQEIDFESDLEDTVDKARKLGLL